MAAFRELAWRPDHRTLRQFGFVALVALSALGLCALEELALFRAGLGRARLPLAAVLLGLGIASGVFSCFLPRANRPLYLALSLLFWPLRIVTSYALLLVLFFLVIGPIAILLRGFAGDRLERRYDRSRASYWLKVAPRRGKRSYFRQF